MKNYQLTYEDACAISKQHNDFNFFKKEYDVSGYKVVVFNYFLCGYNMFANPIPGRSGIHAFDMRGATFVFNHDGTLYKKFLMLPKFFNINEVESTQYHLLKDKKIKSITVKEDGSLIAFMELPNGQIYAKTLGGLDNDQVKAAMKFYDNDINLQLAVDEMITRDYTPLFEYVSFDNKIVLNYKETQLRLIGMRDNVNHDYIPSCQLGLNFKSFLENNGIIIVKSVEDLNLNDLIKICNKDNEIEGFVVEFEDGQLIKCKTQWYFSVHKLHTESINREDYVIETYLNGTLDDILAQFDHGKDSNVFDFVLTIKIAVNKYMEEILLGTRQLYSVYQNVYHYSLTDFATSEHRNPYFKFAKCLIEDDNDSTRCMIAIKEFIIRKAFRLQNARALVEQYKDK
jgi:T4 RnlA family RNA ligase